MSQRIRGWQDLRQFGINYLTGEACKLSLRGLVDVTERGRQIVCDAFGLLPFTRLAPSWNNGSKDDPHTGCVMLMHDLWPSLGIFALLESGCRDVYVVHEPDQSVVLYGFTATPDDQEELDRARSCWTETGIFARRYSYSSPDDPDGTTGSRNRHAMSGRVT